MGAYNDVTDEALRAGLAEVLGALVERRVHLATVQSAEVLPLRDRPELGPLGQIAATLHF
jgi:hypothetical protein